MNAKPGMAELRQSSLIHGDQILRFAAQDVQFSMPLHAVEHVLPLVALQAIPGSPDYLMGLMNFHGMSLPVIDLAIRLGQRQVEKYTLDDAIVLCQHGTKQAGIVATQIIGIETVTEQHLQMQTDVQNASPLFMAIINTPQGASLLLDTEHVVTVDLGKNTSVHQLETEFLDRVANGVK